MLCTYGVPYFQNDVVALPGWHTQWVCLQNNKNPTGLKNNGIKLLEIMSNCNWEQFKKRILSQISVMLQEGDQPRKRLIGDHWVEFLPRSDKPAIIPPEVKKNIPESIFAIRIRIYKKLDAGYMNVLIKEQEKILESKVPHPLDPNKTSQPAAMSGQMSQTLGNSVVYVKAGQDGKLETVQLSQTTHSSGISGFGKLQVAQKTSANNEAVLSNIKVANQGN